MTRCDFCGEQVEDNDELQLHIISCPAILQGEAKQLSDDQQSESENATIQFKWIIDREIDLPTIHLIGSALVNTFELQRDDDCYVSDAVQISFGKYTTQLVIGDEIIPVIDFEIDLDSSIVFLIIDQDSFTEEVTLPRTETPVHNDSSPVPAPNQYLSQRDSNYSPSGQIISSDHDQSNLSPLHKELLEHQIQHPGSDIVNFLQEESFISNIDDIENQTSPHPEGFLRSPDAHTLQNVEEIQDDPFSQQNFQPLEKEDGDSDDQFENFSTPMAPQKNWPGALDESFGGNAHDNSHEILCQSGFTSNNELIRDAPLLQSESSFQTFDDSKEFVKRELEDAMRDFDTESDDTKDNLNRSRSPRGSERRNPPVDFNQSSDFQATLSHDSDENAEGISSHGSFSLSPLLDIATLQSESARSNQSDSSNVSNSSSGGSTRSNQSGNANVSNRSHYGSARSNQSGSGNVSNTSHDSSAKSNQSDNDNASNISPDGSVRSNQSCNGNISNSSNDGSARSNHSSGKQDSKRSSVGLQDSPRAIIRTKEQTQLNATYELGFPGDQGLRRSASGEGYISDTSSMAEGEQYAQKDSHEHKKKSRSSSQHEQAMSPKDEGKEKLIMELQKKCQLYETEISDLRKEVDRLIDRIKNYKEDRDEQEVKLQSYDEELDRWKAKHTKTEEELLWINQQNADINRNLKDGKSALKTRCQKLEEEISTLKMEYDELKFNQQNTDINRTLKDEKLALKTKFQDLEQEISTLKREYDELKEFNEQNADINRNLTDEKLALQTRCLDLEEEISRLKREYDELKFNQQNADINGSLKDEKLALTTRFQELEEEISTMKREYDVLKEFNQQNVDINRNLTDEKLALTTRCQDLEEEIPTMKREYDELKEFNQQNVNININLTDEKLALKTRCQDLEEEISRLKREYDELKNADEEELSWLKREYDELKFNQQKADINRNLNDEKLALDTRCQEQEKEISALKREYDELKSNHTNDNNSNYERAEFEAKCQSYDMEIERLKRENQSLLRRSNSTEKRELELKCEKLKQENDRLRSDRESLHNSHKLQSDEINKVNERLLKKIASLKVKYKDLKAKSMETLPHITHIKDDSPDLSRINIEKLKRENSYLKEKLRTIRTETNLMRSENSEQTTSHQPQIHSVHQYDEKSARNSDSFTRYKSHTPILPNRLPQVNNFTDESESDEQSSRYNPRAYSTYESPKDMSSPSFRNITNFSSDRVGIRRTTSDDFIDHMIKRYNPSITVKNDADIDDSRSWRQRSCHRDYTTTPEPIYARPYKSRSVDLNLDRVGLGDKYDSDQYGRLDHSATRNDYDILTRVPFCPSSVSELYTGMKVSINRTSGRLSRGIVKWIGFLPNHHGDFVGIELESESGKHDGFFDGVRYFRCKQDRGVFIRFQKIVMAWK